MSKKAIVLILVFCLLFLTASDCYGVASHAQATVLMLTGSDEVIFGENVDLRLPMASTTKIMTAVLAIEYGDLSKEITVTDDIVRVEGTSMGLLAGDSVSLYELVCGMLLSSGNDAANTAAVAVCGSIDGFISLMNEKAARIGMKNTHFSTVSGLDADDHYSTASDMALLAEYALDNETFLKICSSTKITVSYGNPPYKRTLTNHNKLLKIYDCAIGVKTGFTKKSGRCLVSAAEKDGCRLICVTLNDSDDFNDHVALLDYGFENVRKYSLCEQSEFTVNIGGADVSSVQARLLYEPYAYFFNDDGFFAEIEIARSLFAPVCAGDVIGTARYYRKNGKTICSVPIILTQSADCNTAENSVKVKRSIFRKTGDVNG